VSKLDAKSREQARKIGLGLALLFRIILLFFLTWLIGLTEPVIEVWGQDFSWRDIVLIAGGLFLLTKATREVHAEIEGLEEGAPVKVSKHAFKWAVAQVIVIDLVFSIDSIVTAIGMAQEIEVMILAVIIAVGVMYVSSGPVSQFVAHYPTTKMLALAFLLLVGVALIADGMGFHIPRAYIYFAMAFSAGVELFNVLARRNRQHRKLQLENSGAKPRRKRRT
jgi:predicted tellurium resistance membrane protein TerC